MREKLEEYCKQTIEDDRYSARYDWAFGAVSFALDAGLISTLDFVDLLDQFSLAHVEVIGHE